MLQENSSGAVVDSHKVKVLLAVAAEKVDADIKGACLRVNGKNVKENRHVKLGSYHTLEIEPGRDVRISKANWDAVSLEFLESNAAAPKAEVGAIQLVEGLGFVCTVRPEGVKILQRVEVAMPKKKLGSTGAAEKAHEKFYTQLIEAAITHLSFSGLRAVVIAAPGSLKDEFHKWAMDWLVRGERKSVLEHKSKLMRVALPGSASVTTLNPHTLLDVLKEPRIADLLADTKSAVEQRLLDQFHKILANDPERCTYGPKQVRYAVKECAVKQLLLADGLFRSTDVKERTAIGRLIGEVKENGGQVLIFSPGTTPNEELEKLTGIAAILNFPLEMPPP